MKTPHKGSGSVLQNGSRPPSKHDANLRKSGTIHFQIGLIVAMLLALFLLESKSPVKIYNPSSDEDVATVTMEDWDQNFQVEQKQKVEATKQQVTHVDLPPEVVPDDVEKNAIDVEFRFEDPNIPEFDIGSLTPVIDDSKIEDLPYDKVEIVPIYPGCEGLDDNTARKICMQEKLKKLIQRHFNAELGQTYGLEGINRIDVQFAIDENGKVSDVKVRAPHPALEKEAKRVVAKIPLMTPGRQKNKNVRVIYGQPIVFKTEY